VKRVRQLSAVVLAATGVFLAFAGLQLRLEGQYGPGPGFLAFWVGLALAIFSVVWFGQVVLAPASAVAAWDESQAGGLVRVAAIILALIAFAALLTSIGFKLVMLALLLGLFFAYDWEHVLAKIVVAVAGSVGTHYVFERFLRVPLPDASVPALRSLGF
jgi:putative tricarboxylic transport membrane protein